jgi:inhibitor of KinA
MSANERPYLSFAPLGDRALLLEVGETVDESVIARLRALAEQIEARRLPGVTDIVPAFCSLALHYDPAAVRASGHAGAPYDALVESLQALLSETQETVSAEGRLFEVPVVYGGAFGEDLAALAEAKGLTPEEASRIHREPLYSVYMLGFAPGFGYLGPVDARLREPRRSGPRPKVAAGSVALANEYTGIYPLESPGGWHVIGRTPWRLFDVHRSPPSLLAAGDRVRFVSISPAEFDNAGRSQPWR